MTKLTKEALEKYLLGNNDVKKCFEDELNEALPDDEIKNIRENDTRISSIDYTNKDQAYHGTATIDYLVDVDNSSITGTPHPKDYVQEIEYSFNYNGKITDFEITSVINTSGFGIE